MTTKDLLVDDGRDGQTVETVRERLPQLDVVTTFALVIESVDPVNTGTFMIAAEEEEVLWVLDLVRQEEADGLEALLASVDVIAQEEII